MPVDLDRAGDVAGLVEQHVLVGLDHDQAAVRRGAPPASRWSPAARGGRRRRTWRRRHEEGTRSHSRVMRYARRAAAVGRCATRARSPSINVPIVAAHSAPLTPGSLVETSAGSRWAGPGCAAAGRQRRGRAVRPVLGDDRDPSGPAGLPHQGGPVVPEAPAARQPAPVVPTSRPASSDDDKGVSAMAAGLVDRLLDVGIDGRGPFDSARTIADNALSDQGTPSARSTRSSPATPSWRRPAGS